LAFVSLWYISACSSSTSVQHKKTRDAFDDFNDAVVPSQKPAAKAAPTKPAMKPEERIEELKKQIRAQPKNYALIVTLAEELYKTGADDKVTALLWKYVDKIDRRGLILLAKAHEKRKEPNETIRALNVLLGKSPNDYEAHTMIGDAYAMALKNKEALESYKKALEINKKYEPAYIGLVNLYEKRDPPNLYELRILFQDMMEAIGPRAQYMRRLCEINALDGTYEAAIQMCNDAIAKEPRVAEPYVYLGLSQKANGDEALGNKTLKQAATDFPKSELAQYNHAKVLEEKKSYVDALNTYKKATDADPKAARSWLGLATTSFEIRKYEISLIAYRNACRYDKKNAVAFRKATTVLRNQRNAEWIAKFEEASETCTF
jgi:tetratricopeptide (TPR) repeat protein